MARPSAVSTSEASGWAQLFSEQIAIALTNALTASEAIELAEQRRESLRFRDVIGQAKGILMAQRMITADAAFEELCVVSQRQNRKLRDVAEDLARNGTFADR